MSQHQDVKSSDEPGLVIISNVNTPYRQHVHDRIVNELPDVRLHSIFTHDIDEAKWKIDLSERIEAVQFGRGEIASKQSKFTQAPHEWRKGGRIARWIVGRSVGAVVVMGYNDLGRLRLINWCRRNSVPCFLGGDSNIHGDQATGLKGCIKRIIVGWAVRNVDGVLPCGTLGEAYFSKYGAKRTRMFRFPYEPDYELIQGLDQEFIDNVRRRFGLDPGRRRAVYSGRLVQVKRVDLLIEAFVAIADSRPQWDLVIVGDGPLRKTLAAGIPPRLASRIIWTGFIDDQAIVSAIYRSADVLVLPSDYEPWALVINEAAAAGMAIVSSDVVGAAADLVRDGENGRLFKSGNVQSLLKCLSDVMDSKAIDSLKQASLRILADWREKSDPIQGLRRALQSVGCLQNLVPSHGGA